MEKILIESHKNASVYKVTENGRDYLYKVINTDYPSSAELASFLNEFSILDKKRIHGVRNVIRRDQLDGREAYVMEYAKGESLSEYSLAKGLDTPEFLTIASQMAAALSEVHRNHIIHRDIKPANFIYNKESKEVLLIDFGLASVFDIRLMHSGNPEKLAGSLAYISPEQTGRMNRIVDYRSDLYSLGATFYYLLTGFPPFRSSDPMELVHSHIALNPPAPDSLVPGIPKQISEIVMRLLSKNAESRYQSASGLRADLDRCSSELLHRGIISEFAPGGLDRSLYLHIPEKLYGREKEVALLEERFRITAAGGKELVLVSGQPGVGKTAVIYEIHKNVSLSGAYFIQGKFDRFQKDSPFHGITQAVSEFTEFLLTENERELEYWRNTINQAAGENGRILTDLIPALEAVTGPQPELAPAEGHEAYNRMIYIFTAFFRAVCSHRHPVVIFLDDLQWMDPASADLLRALMTDSHLGYLMIAGAYRDNETDSTHPLSAAKEAIHQKYGSITEIKLEPVTEKDVTRLCADTLSSEPEATADLGHVVWERTGGNPFFVKEYINRIYEKSLLLFNEVNNRWEWNVIGIRALELSTNVVELLQVKIRELPEESAAVIRYASCLGSRFSLRTLSAVTGIPSEEIAGRLMPAINSGVIVPANDDFRFAFQTGADKDTSFECYFAHDRLQETAYGMVDASEKAALHLHTARHISQLAGNSGDPELLMMIANHYNEAADLISEKEEKLKAAEFNTQAGNRAVRAAAYDSAFHYFSGAWKLLTEEDWNLNYPLMLSAGGSLAETAFFAGKFREAEETALTVIHHAADKKDSLQARYVLLLTYTALNRLNDVLNEGSKALRILNIRIPVKANPYHIVKSMIRVRMILRRHKVEDLVHLPEMDNKDMLLAMKIMQKMTPVAFRSGSNMFPVLIFNLAYITARFGLAPISIFAFGAYSIALCGVLGDTDKGYRFGKLIMEMPKHIKGGNSVISHAVFLWNNFIRHWKEPIALYVDDFMQAYRNGFENGYLFEVVWTAHHRSLWSFFTGRELVSIRSQLDEIQDLVYVDKAADDMVRALRQTCSNLADPGCPEPWNLYGEFYNDSDADSYAPTEKAFYYLKKMLLYMIFDRHPEALAAVEKGDKVADALTSMPGYSLQIFLSALIRLRAYRKIRKERKHLVYAQKAVKKFRKWAADVPATHLHRQYLIQAEIYRAEGKINKASEFFDLAVDAVQKGEARLNVLEEAIVFEKAADFFLETGRRIYARSLVQYAYSSYDRIGAAAKTEFIKRRFPDFSWAVYRAPGESYSESVSMSVSTRSSSESSAATGGGSLDLISIIKSTQAISGEMVLDDLLKKVMTFIMENAGADKGTLMINDLNSSGLYVRCVGNAADKENTVRLLNEPAEGYDDIPHSVIQLVLRSRKEVVTDNPVEERKFDSDPYFKEKRPRSLLCMPVMYQGRSNGVLYLENSLNHGAFNQNRLQIISMITVQAAVSIHNAMLYESVKDSWQKERELKNAYRSFVPEEFLSILGKGSILEVKPGDYKETQMTVMFSDIRSFTSLSETMSPQDNFRFLNEFLHKMEPAITENHGFIDKYIGDSIMALFPHKADDAVAAGVAMMQRLKSYNRQRAENGQPEIRIGIGINSGHLMLGTIGTRGRMDGTVISDAVNIASRLESANKKLGTTMLISEETYKQLSEPEKFNIEQLGSVQLRGRNESIMIYEVKE